MHTGPLHDPVTWYRINYDGTQVTQWDFPNNGTCTSLTQHRGKTYAHASTFTFPVCTFFFWYHIYLAANFTKFDLNNLLYCCNRSLWKSMLPFYSISFNFLVRRFRKSLQQSKAVRTSMSVIINRCFCSVVRDTGGLLSGYEVNLHSSSTVVQHLWHHLLPGLYTCHVASMAAKTAKSLAGIHCFPTPREWFSLGTEHLLLPLLTLSQCTRQTVEPLHLTFGSSG